jgi:hypothetical protein
MTEPSDSGGEGMATVNMVRRLEKTRNWKRKKEEETQQK